MSALGIRKRQDITCVKINEDIGIDSSIAEQILSNCIESRTDDSVTHQLKRIQRDLRGLPPLLRNSATGEVVNVDTVDARKEAESLEAMEMDIDSSKKDISKEERKRLKKERRKQEKKAKAEKRHEHREDEGDEGDEEQE